MTMERDRGLEDELDYWDRWLGGRGMKWAADFETRLDPTFGLQARLLRYLPSDRTKARILDVGSGPLTALGKVAEGYTLDIVAVDPLADSYDALLAKHGITPLVRAIRGAAERIAEGLPAESFDLVYAQNSLDHSLDPLAGIAEMIKLMRRGGYVVLYHALDEGVRQSYRGLHQWNLGTENGRFIVWNRETRVDVAEHLGPAYVITSEIINAPMLQVAITTRA